MLDPNPSGRPAPTVPGYRAGTDRAPTARSTTGRDTRFALGTALLPGPYEELLAVLRPPTPGAVSVRTVLDVTSLAALHFTFDTPKGGMAPRWSPDSGARVLESNSSQEHAVFVLCSPQVCRTFTSDRYGLLGASDAP